MTSGPGAPDPQSFSPRSRAWTRFVAETAENGIMKIVTAHTFRKSRSHTAPLGEAPGGKGPHLDYLVSNFSEKSRL